MKRQTMKKIRPTRLAFILALGATPLALAACEETTAATTAPQDAPVPQLSRARGPGGPGLFRGIELSDEQRAQLRAVHDTFRAEFEAMHAELAPLRKQLAEARRSGDRERVRQLMADARAAREKAKPVHERMLAAMRAVLTPEQQAQFDANVARLQERHGRGARQRGRHALARLDLTEAQRTQVRQIMERHRPELEALHADLRPLRERIADARRSGDDTALEQLRSESKPLRERARAIHEAIRDEIREVLTPEQRERFDAHAARATGRHAFGRMHRGWHGR
ncbi:MAG TPA: Spy/CpxP family protein refolding chaperone [Longimicrobiales bacterium]